MPRAPIVCVTALLLWAAPLTGHALAQAAPRAGQFGEALTDEDIAERERQQADRETHANEETAPEAGQAQMGLDHPEETRDAFTITDEAEASANARHPTMHRLGRVGAELGGMVTGAIVGGVAGGIAGLPFVYLADVTGSTTERFSPAFVGGALGALALAPYALWLTGRALDGNGKLLWTYVGALGGGFLFGSVAALAGSSRGAAGGLGVTGVVLGGVLGYELTSNGYASPDPNVPPPLSWTVVPTAGGVLFGARGSF